MAKRKTTTPDTDATNKPTLLGLLKPEAPEWKEGMINLMDLPIDTALLGGPPSAALVNSVTFYGVMEPILLTGNETAPDVIDGRRRIKAARKAGHLSIPYRYTADVDAALLSVTANATRSDNPMSDLAAIERLMKQGMSPAEISKATGLARPTIERRQKLVNLIPHFRTMAERGACSMSVLEDVAKLSHAKQEGLAALTKDKARLTAKDVHDARSVTKAATLDMLDLGAIGELPDDTGSGGKWERIGMVAKMGVLAALRSHFGSVHITDAGIEIDGATYAITLNRVDTPQQPTTDEEYF